MESEMGRLSSLKVAIKQYWPFYVAWWLFPIYFYSMGRFYFKDDNIDQFFVLVLVPLFIVYSISNIPYFQKKLSFRLVSLLDLGAIGMWIVCVAIGSFY